VKTRSGFTLIELLVVLALLSILAFIISPKLLSRVKPEKTKHFLLTIQHKLEYLNETTVLKRQFVLFNFDLDEKRYYFTTSEEGGGTGGTGDRYLAGESFPDHLEVTRVRLTPGDTVYSGNVVIPFTPAGMMQSFMIYVREEGERELVLSGDSITNIIELLRLADEELSPVR
jgi:prepilin-type N-terminal cleavage/methylation domain-containing protein